LYLQLNERVLSPLRIVEKEKLDVHAEHSYRMYTRLSVGALMSNYFSSSSTDLYSRQTFELILFFSLSLILFLSCGPLARAHFHAFEDNVRGNINFRGYSRSELRALRSAERNYCFFST
jgi:hypothetical protein